MARSVNRVGWSWARGRSGHQLVAFEVVGVLPAEGSPVSNDQFCGIARVDHIGGGRIHASLYVLVRLHGAREYAVEDIRSVGDIYTLHTRRYHT